MAEYIKHNSNYIKTVRHQFLKDGSSIYERDWVTVGSQLNFGPGKVPYYNDGNFIFTTSPTPFYQKRYKNGVTVGVWTYEDVKKSSDVVNKINFDEHTEDIRTYAYYGSCLELVKSSIENIIFNFPGNITLTKDRLEIPPTTSSGSYTYINGYVVSNPFKLDLHTKNVHLGKYDNELHFLSYSWAKYTVNGQPITSYKISNWMGDLNCPQNDQYYIKKAPVVTVTINNSIVLKGYKSDDEIIFCYEGQQLLIQPQDEIIEDYFNNLKGFEKQLLTRKTNPKFSNRFVTPIEYESEILYYKRTYTWPSNDYCIDITSPLYFDFLNKLINMAQLFDELWTDNLWRRMTHESIKNYDWTYTREYEEGDEIDNVEGGDRMHKVINVIGRVFDDIKRVIDTIKKNNRVTYNGDRNIPNALLSDKLELRGWDIYSTIPNYINEEGFLASEAVIEGNVNWYPTLDPSMMTFADVDNQFMRRLLMSTRRIFETKGTRHSIEMIMALFGYGNMDEENPEYSITEEYYTVIPRNYDEEIIIEDSEETETLGDRIVRLNTRNKEIDLIYDNDTSGIPVDSFVVFDKDEETQERIPTTYLIPFYNYDKLYDGNLYFQNKGGWFYNGTYENSDSEVNEFSWTETVSYLHVVPQVSDLLNVNPITTKNGDIFYVTNVNDYINYTEEPLYSNFFVLEDDFNVEKFSSWTNLNLEDGWYEESQMDYSNYAKKAKYLETIIPYTIGNNPHVGYGMYDMGNEFYEYMKQPFKYSVDRGEFDTVDHKIEAENIRFDTDADGNTTNEEGKLYWEQHKALQNDDKIQIIAKKEESEQPEDSGIIETYYDIVSNEETEENNNWGVLRRREYNLKAINEFIKENYFINCKVIHFKNLINDTTGNYITYFKEVIMKYLMQIIPSTAIFVLENFEVNNE